jgi:hypothetical protein
MRWGLYGKTLLAFVIANGISISGDPPIYLKLKVNSDAVAEEPAAPAMSPLDEILAQR